MAVRRGLALGLTMKSESPHQKNIQAICEFEEQELARRTLSDRFGDLVATEAGKMWFIAAHMIWFTIWIVLSLRGAAFDPFPFPLLTMIVSLESIFLSLFILMSQNRAGLQADRRNHLDLQINLLAEDENTKLIQMLRAICQHHGLRIANDPEVIAMAETTDVGGVISDLTKNLPSQS